MALTLKERIAHEAEDLGFAAVRFASADPPQGAGEALDAFLADGRHGDMTWLAANSERRKSPRAIWPEVKSIIMLGLSYGPERDPLEVLGQRSRGAISVYAQGADYHDVIKAKLKTLAARVQGFAPGEFKIFVDTAPVMEKPIAAKAGLGWQGKHTNLVSRTHGSWLFLGSLFTTADLYKDEPERDHCGSCRACLDACPTGAFPAPYKIDARRCISYLTIEHKGPIDPELRPLIGNRIYGCDDCLAACPWNKFAQAASEMKLVARPDLREPTIASLLMLDDAAFRTFFSGSPVKRIGRDRFIRNVLIAAGNSGDRALIDRCRILADDASPVVRAMAVWALSRLMEAGELEDFAANRDDEEDTGVRAEWRLAGVTRCI